MGTAAKFGLLVLMALVIALARFLEGEVRLKKKPKTPPIAIHKKPEIKAAQPNARSQAAQPSAQPQTQPQQQNPASPAPANTGKSYKVRKGDTLGRISRRVYGSSRHWKSILRANSFLRGKAKNLKPGQTLSIPTIKK